MKDVLVSTLLLDLSEIRVSFILDRFAWEFA